MRPTWMGKPERVRLRDEAESSGATWTGSPKGVFEERKHHNQRQAKSRLFVRRHLRGGFEVELALSFLIQHTLAAGATATYVHPVGRHHDD
jgi:hypothetical protein